MVRELLFFFLFLFLSFLKVEGREGGVRSFGRLVFLITLVFVRKLTSQQDGASFGQNLYV